MLLTAGLIGAVCVASVGVAQSPPPPMRGHPMEMRHGARGHDGVASLLDHQLALQLTATQVNQLITIHQQEVAQEKPLFARMMSLMPQGRDRSTSITPAQRDSLGAIRESMREIQWRQVSAAAAVLNDDQKRIAARLQEHHKKWGKRDGMGRDSTAKSPR
jgi:hypothetical protein